MKKVVIEELAKIKVNSFNIQTYKEKYKAKIKELNADIETKIIIERLLNDMVEYSGSASLNRLKVNYSKAVQSGETAYIECLKDNTLCLFMELACFTNDEVIRDYFKQHSVHSFVKKYDITNIVLTALL